MEYLVVLEISQKQNYIFKTNRLQENIGASMVIRELTEVLPEEVLKGEELTGKGRIVLRGGGKSVYAFSDEEDARTFTKKVSSVVLKEYPGIELFMATQGYDEGHEAIAEAVDLLYGRLEAKKSARESSFAFYDLGITRQCESTQLPAVMVENGRYLSSASQLKRQKARESQKDEYRNLLPANGRYRFANEFEELIGDEKSYIAVVVIDGNKMGKKIESFRENFAKTHPTVSKESNEEYKREFLELSSEIDRVYKEAMRMMIGRLPEIYEELVRSRVIVANRVDKDGTMVLPIRPLIQAGDDICFVTNGRLGIALAEEVLRNVEKIKMQGYAENFTMRAAAGVALVKVKYPFFRAHELAEELCHSAKARLGDDEDLSVLDFHVVQGEIEGSLSQIRREKYQNKTLTEKPYDVDGSFEIFKNTWYLFKQQIAQGKIGRGAFKEFRNALVAGEEATKRFITTKQFGTAFNGAISRGFYFDALEMLDLYYELGGATNEKVSD